MSWDIIIQDLPKDATTVAGIPHDFKPSVLGTRREVIVRIQEILPNADFKDPAWGILDGDGFRIELNVGSEEICEGIMLHVRGGGNAAVAIVARLLQHLNLRSVDCQSGDFFRIDAAQDSFQQWQAYRDCAIRKMENEKSPPC